MTDIEIIKLLEKDIGYPLNRVGIKDLWKEKSYALNDQQKVQGINLNGCTLNQFPRRLTNLKFLQHLYLAENQFEKIENILTEFRRLQELVLDNNQLKKFPISITKLKRLRKLSIVNNQLTEVPNEVRELKNLEILSLSKNHIHSLPQDFNQLKNLVYIYLNDNRIKDWSEAFYQLKKLKVLDLRNNWIVNLPTKALKLNLLFKWERAISLEGIFLEGNPLEKPPIEILKKGDKAIRTYLESIKEQSRPLNEVKVLLVGDGGAGKTSLMRRLMGKNFNKREAQTHGINIETYCVKTGHQNNDIKIHYWDFGGQEIMHASHQFFLSKRSLYILVLDSRKDAKTEYWLKHIESFGGESPILIVLNKVDENPAFEVNRKFLQEKYKGIIGFYRISCLNRKGMEELEEAVQNTIFQLPHLQTPWSLDWFSVKNQLENTNKDYITYDDYLALCQKYKIKEKDAQNTLLEYLNDLGVMLHFGDDINLKQTSVLNPKWVTQAVYKIINSKELADQHGILKLEHLDTILKRKKGRAIVEYDYPHTTHQYIINLMSRFKLCYRLNDHTLLLPDLLDVEEVRYHFDEKNLLQFIFQYDFFPRSIMPRFIVDMHDDIKERKHKRLLWRTGIVLENKRFNAIALIKADEEAKKINILVGGEQKRDYFAVIRHNLTRIHDSFEKLTINELIPLSEDGKHTVDFAEILGYEKAGKDTYFSGKLGKDFQVNTLLDGIERAEDRQKRYASDVPEVTAPLPQAPVATSSTPLPTRPTSTQPEMSSTPKWFESRWWPILIATSILMTILGGIAGFLEDGSNFISKILSWLFG